MKKITITLLFICAIASTFAQNNSTESEISGWYNYAELFEYEQQEVDWIWMMQDSNAMHRIDQQ